MQVMMGTDTGRAIFDAIIQAALQYLVTLVPFLGYPGISLVVGWLVGKLADALYTVLAKLKITFEVDAQNADFKAALEKLKKAQEGGNAEEIKKAVDDFKSRVHDLVHY